MKYNTIHDFFTVVRTHAMFPRGAQRHLRRKGAGIEYSSGNVYINYSEYIVDIIVYRCEFILEFLNRSSINGH